MRKIVTTISNANQTVTPLETIDAIYKAGFKDVFIEWYNKDWEITQEQQLEYVQKCGLNVIFAHLGYQGINNLWIENEAGEALVERYQKDLQICKENGIDLVCMHLTSKSEAPGPNETGIRRLQIIADTAKQLGIKIAFENTKIKGYQEYVLNHIKNENVGICLDSGHLHAHFQDELDFEMLKNKIFCVHLHDNFGVKDQHLIPFEGTIDWNWLTDQLKRCNYDGPITMELVYQNEYVGNNLVEFYQKGYKAGEKIAQLMK